MSLKIGYFGSPDLSARLLEQLIENHISIELVVSNEDRPRGRSGTPVPTDVSRVALTNNIPLYRFSSLKAQEAETALRRHNCDLYFIFAYGKLLPANIYKIPDLGSVNLHASLLPLLRGASPIQSAILQGFNETGWTIQMISDELDAGDILLERKIAVNSDDTAGDLTERLLPPGIEASLDLIHNFHSYYKQKKAQDHTRATFCTKIKKEMTGIDWNQDAFDIHNKIRAFNPAPVTRTKFKNKVLKIHLSRYLNEIPDHVEKQLMKAPPGQCLVYPEGKNRKLFVKTGNGILEILKMQPENKNIMEASSFINGYRLVDGDYFESL